MLTGIGSKREEARKERKIMLTQSKLIQLLRQKNPELTVRKATTYVRSMLNEISFSIRTGERIQIRGIMTGKIKLRKGRTYCGPVTDYNHITTQDRKIYQLKASKKF